MDWSDLIADLATLTLNEVEAFALLGLPLPRVP
jgi:hypothetical protein